MLESLFDKFDNIIVLDTETSGLDSKREEIIELAMLRVSNKAGQVAITDKYDEFIRLSPGKVLSETVIIPDIFRYFSRKHVSIKDQGTASLNDLSI